MSFPSYFNSSILIDHEHSAVTMICNSKRQKNHALLAVERIDGSHRHTIHLVHLMGAASYQPPNEGVFHGCCCSEGFRRIGKVDIIDRTGREVDFTHKSPTWLRSAARVQELMRQIELEKDKPSEFPKPFSIFGNKSVLARDLETFKITDPLVAAIANCDMKLFLKLYDRAKKCRDGVGIEKLNERYFYPLHSPRRDDDGGYNIANHATDDVWNNSTTDRLFLLGFSLSGDPPFCWSFHISNARKNEIADLFIATQTSEERERLIEEAPQQEKEFFISVKKSFETMLRIHQAGLTNTRTFLWYKGDGKKINDLAAKIIAKYPELEERVVAFIDEFNDTPISTCCQLLLTIYNSTDLCILTPDSCFTWAREKLTLIDVEMPNVGLESCISPTRCYLTPIKKGCC